MYPLFSQDKKITIFTYYDFFMKVSLRKLPFSLLYLISFFLNIKKYYFTYKIIKVFKYLIPVLFPTCNFYDS